MKKEGEGGQNPNKEEEEAFRHLDLLSYLISFPLKLIELKRKQRTVSSF